MPIRAQRVPVGDRWLHEIKHDGYRMLCSIEEGQIRFISRQQLDWRARLPSLVECARRLRVDQAILDGELVYLKPDGRSCFDSLEHAIRSGRSSRLVYLALDLLYLNGHDLTAVLLEARKDQLAHVLPAVDGDRFCRVEHFEGDGEAFYRAACEMGLEGTVSKRRDAPYLQMRSRTWLKVKWRGWKSHGENWK